MGCNVSIRRCVRRGEALQNSEYKSVGYGKKAVELNYGGFRTMTIDELKKLLDDGKITKEQFKSMALALDPNFKEDDPDHDPDKGKDKDKGPDIEKMIQQAVDRATNKLGNDNKRLREELDTIKKEKLTAEERAELEKKQEREQFERERAEFQQEKNKLYAVKAIKAAGLDDGSDKALELVNFVLAGDEKEIDSRVKAFGELVKKFVASEVDKTFKDAGRNPGKGASGGDEKNPYTKEYFNLTEQMKLEATDPEKAKRLQAAALAAKQ